MGDNSFDDYMELDRPKKDKKDKKDKAKDKDKDKDSDKPVVTKKQHEIDDLFAAKVSTIKKDKDKEKGAEDDSDRAPKKFKSDMSSASATASKSSSKDGKDKDYNKSPAGASAKESIEPSGRRSRSNSLTENQDSGMVTRSRSNSLTESSSSAKFSTSSSESKSSVASKAPTGIVQIEAMNTVPIDNFNISGSTKAALLKRGFQCLLPIQAATFEHIRAGKDLIGRAKTGQGKTLAFCLPILEQLIEKDLVGKKIQPKALIMSPTRELARQIVEEFVSISSVLRIEAIYGGTSLNDNFTVIKKGIDVVVGTPGRIKDLLDR